MDETFSDFYKQLLAGRMRSPHVMQEQDQPLDCREEIAYAHNKDFCNWYVGAMLSKKDVLGNLYHNEDENMAKLPNMEPTSNEELEKLLAESPAERVTQEYITSRIGSVTYTRLPSSTMTVCHLMLDNGFDVIGESACVNPANYNQAIGEKIAYDNAFNKLWPLFGFLLAEKNKLKFGN